MGHPDSSDRADHLRADGVAIVAGSVTDLAGVTRAKYVPVSRLGAFTRAGMGVSPSWSVFCVDSGIAFTPSIGVAGDLRIRIDPDDVRVVEDGVAWAPGSLNDQYGEPAPLCTRTLLARYERAATDHGLDVQMGAELECTMLAADGGPATTEPWSPYGIRTSLDRSAFLVDLAATAERAGLPVEQLHTEYGHDQLEISLAPDTPVAAADAVILARIVLSRAAARHGLRISFSPVPFDGAAGNGAHLHLSLSDAEGPLLSGGDGPRGLRTSGAAAIAGVLDTLPDLLGLYAGSAVSALRLKPGNWAGATACWGLENREAAVRLIAATPGNPHGANMELKLIDPSANPYLAAAAFLGSALRGIDRTLALPEEIPENPAQSGISTRPLPLAQREALEAMDTSKAAAELLTSEIVEALVAVRRYELETFGDMPPAQICDALRLAWTC
ncbi:glutamine synthetase family protein [Mycolicibacterium rufum]|uniref:Glutamine synthetase n=1 Tax=Mycolicibacterium rufum TaxID=318424 RepID=A0A9X2Y994_9MYCO|nr:glutamine synthetase family protein [Mycolicibacterium rufum]KGI68506.1 glutamine synthetase [Mycolicibacterium rufum]MCV7069498.1 glutamine synthetase [Mycolicibacterium rufum]ULP34627.1 glutamine synthetase family protein [Mycolicibacterium rufum]